VHALWLDERGNIRDDCGPDSCGALDQDAHLDKTLDHILQFYTDPISSAARARVFSDDNGDGHYDPDTDQLEDNISLRDIRYIWSAGEWLSQVTQANVAVHRTYGEKDIKQRHILTSLDGASMIPFTPADLRVGILAADAAYQGYFNAGTPAEADKIVNYIRGLDQAGYRSRSIDWDENGTPEIWKLGDVVNSTPTVVSTPAEDYDLIYDDYSYQAFRKRYRNRRAMVYAGGNDGGFHAFNGGYYNRATYTIDKAPPPDTDGVTKVDYDLGAEMWMFVPRNLFPHLKWLTDPKYSHVNYVDFKPYVFDAKIFPPDYDHPHGWGTVLVGGLGFGGGDIEVDTDGDVVDDLTLRSQYFILDITNPEVAPRILGEFTHPNLGFTVGAPTAVPILLCELKVDCPAKSTAWPMDWYLAFPSGPYHDTEVQAALNGISNQNARLFTVPLGGTGGLALANVTAPVGSTYTSFTVDDTTNFPNSFFSDVIAVDYDLNFKTDTLYFGSVANAIGDDPSQHTGGMHRLVIGEDADTLSNPWGLYTFFKTPGNQPVSGSPSVSYDGRRAWIYFGTGRYYSAQLDKANHAQQSYYGIKEQYDAAGVMQLTQLSDANLIDVSDVWVEAGGDLHLTTGTLSLKAYNYSNSIVTSADLPAEVTTFAKLDKVMSVENDSDLDKYNGWKLDFDQLGERNLGQAAILGSIVTFTTFVPSEDICQPEGESFLWAPYYRTGTAYLSNVIGTVARGGETEVLRKLSVGVGLASTPNIHTGAEAGSTAFVQTSTGAIISVQQNNPGVVKGGMISWRELGD
jgi:type IV pilus assembly protein PilY1